MATALMGAAMFQRKSRSGWLDELDGIRQDALAVPGGEVALAMAASSIPGGGDREWPEPEELQVDDQYGIASLYADDEEPETPPPAPRGRRRRGAPTPPPPVAPVPPDAALPPPPPAPPASAGASLPPPPPPTGPSTLPPPPPTGTSTLPPPPVPQVASTVEPSHEVATSDLVGEDEGGDQERRDNWAQPAPHPIRPNELWHAAVAPELAAGPPAPPAVEERVTSSDLLGTEDRRRFPTFRPVDIAPAATAAAEDALHRPVEPGSPVRPESVPMVPLAAATPSANGLISGPVARRVRRDRPVDRSRHALPTVGTSEERSPLPEAGLAPAALPPNPASPAPLVEPLLPEAAAPAPRPPMSVAEPSPADASPAVPPVVPAAAAPTPMIPAPATEVEALAVPEALLAVPAQEALGVPVQEALGVPAPTGPDASAPAVAVAPSAAPAVPVPLEIAADGRVSVPGTIVRIGGAGRAAALAAEIGPQVVLTEGWAWVAPSEAHGVDAVVVLPAGVLVVRHGATVLAVVEADASTFVLVASGEAELRRGEDQAGLPPGTMVMLSPQGAPQIDEAAPEEIEGDPIVAANRELDRALGRL